MKNNKIDTVSVMTLGCSKNVVDSEEFISQLRANGIALNENPEDADALIINTCGFIKPAKEESIQVILEASELRRKGKIKRLIVTGCLSERYKKELEDQLTDVDHVFGVNSTKQIVTSLAGDYRHNLIGEQRLLTPKHYTYIKISEGCDHPCSFCAIPVIRGKFRSYPEEKIIKEVSALAQKGTKEFILIAQDSTYYGKDIYGKKSIAALLEKIAGIDGVNWLRLMYQYPTAYPYELLDTIAKQDNICNYVDIPFQHASDKVLKSMRRGITRRKTEELIESIRSTIPNAAIRSTFIVGYPNETEEDFLELLDFIKTVRLDRVGVFTYSLEEDTFAFPMEDPVPKEVKESRRNALMEAQLEISLEKNKAKTGKELKVFIDSFDGENYHGRTEHDAPDVDNSVIFTSEKKLNPGDFVKVKITNVSEYDLYGYRL